MPATSILVSTSARAGMKRPRRRPAIIASPIQTGSHLSNVDNCRLAAGAGAGVFVLVVFGGAGIVLLSLLVSSGDRKSTRLNSSHVAISYAVFCLKKKKKRQECQYTSSTNARNWRGC